MKIYFGHLYDPHNNKMITKVCAAPNETEARSVFSKFHPDFDIKWIGDLEVVIGSNNKVYNIQLNEVGD